MKTAFALILRDKLDEFMVPPGRGFHLLRGSTNSGRMVDKMRHTLEALRFMEKYF